MTLSIAEAFLINLSIEANGLLYLIDINLSQEDVYEPTKMEGKQLKGMKVVTVSSGGQHTVLIAKKWPKWVSVIALYSKEKFWFYI